MVVHDLIPILNDFIQLCSSNEEKSVKKENVEEAKEWYKKRNIAKFLKSYITETFIDPTDLDILLDVYRRPYSYNKPEAVRTIQKFGVNLEYITKDINRMLKSNKAKAKKELKKADERLKFIEVYLNNVPLDADDVDFM